MDNELIERQAEIIARRDPKAAYWFAREAVEADRAALQQIIIESKDPEYAYAWASDFEHDGADVSALQKIIINAKNPELAYQFAFNVDRADIAALQQVIIQAKDSKWAYWFARNVGGDIDALGGIIRESGTPNEQELFQIVRDKWARSPQHSGGR